MTGLIKAKLVGYEDVNYIRKSDGCSVSGRRLFITCANPQKGSVGDYANSLFTSAPEAKVLMVGDLITLFRDDYSLKVPLRFVPDSF